MTHPPPAAAAAHAVQDTLEQVKLENEERAALGQGKPYDRQLP